MPRIEPPLAADSLTEKQFNAVIERGFTDLAEGRIISAEDVSDRMWRD
jgi:predicted transcriptional regulator